jgi:hypothetical protein
MIQYETDECLVESVHCSPVDYNGQQIMDKAECVTEILHIKIQIVCHSLYQSLMMDTQTFSAMSIFTSYPSRLLPENTQLHLVAMKIKTLDNSVQYFSEWTVNSLQKQNLNTNLGFEKTVIFGPNIHEPQ